MTIENLLLNDLTPANLKTDLHEMISLMEEYRFTHFPVINSEKLFIGNISYEKLITEINVIKAIVPNILEDFSATDDDFFLSSISTFGTYKTNIIPVIDNQKRYIGYVSLEDYLTELAKYPFFNDHFNWLTIQNTTAKFAMSDVAKILESNNARSVGILINSQDENLTSAHIRFQAENIDSLVQTFERFNYTVKVYKNEGEYTNLLQDRYSNLLRYMDI